MRDDIVTRLRLRPTILRKNQFGDMETDRVATALFDDCHAIMREAADEIERLRKLVENSEQLKVERSEMVKTANLLRNGIHRVYMVRATDYLRGTVMPVRIATANTLAAMIDRCAEDCYGKDAKQVGTGSWDLSVIVTVGELEVQSE